MTTIPVPLVRHRWWPARRPADVQQATTALVPVSVAPAVTGRTWPGNKPPVTADRAVVASPRLCDGCPADRRTDRVRGADTCVAEREVSAGEGTNRVGAAL